MIKPKKIIFPKNNSMRIDKVGDYWEIQMYTEGDWVTCLVDENTGLGYPPCWEVIPCRSEDKKDCIEYLKKHRNPDHYFT
jgi:hypothetical protein